VRWLTTNHASNIVAYGSTSSAPTDSLASKLIEATELMYFTGDCPITPQPCGVVGKRQALRLFSEAMRQVRDHVSDESVR
jgi:hypothetical protein